MPELLLSSDRLPSLHYSPSLLVELLSRQVPVVDRQFLLE